MYKKRLAVLAALTAALAAVYILTLVFDPARRADAAFAWLQPRQHELADRIEIAGPAGDSVLIRRNNTWLVAAAGNEYPVRQQRVQELLAALSRRDIYTLRSTSLQARERLGLSAGTASRIQVRGGAGLPLVDLLIGASGAVGREIYLARADEREIYSGEDRFTRFTDTGTDFWLDFRLSGSAPRTAAMVQQAEVNATPANAPPFAYTLRRSGTNWVLHGNETTELAAIRVEDWLRTVLEAEASHFATAQALPPAAITGSITLHFGDGTHRTIQTGTLEGGSTDSEPTIGAVVSTSPLVYALSPRTINRLFRESSEFIR